MRCACGRSAVLSVIYGPDGRPIATVVRYSPPPHNVPGASSHP